MEKLTLRNIKQFVKFGAAIDLTNADDLTLRELENHLEQIARSVGSYGMSGGLFRDRRDGKLYAVTARSGALFRLM